MSDDRFDRMMASLKKAGAVLRDADVPFAVGGGFAIWARGGTASDHDVDLLLKEDDAERALAALADAGMRCERPPEGWLVKAYDGDVLVDLIYRPAGLEVDDALLARCEPGDFEAMQLPVLPPDDVLVSKLFSLTEHELDYDGLLELTRLVREQIDWDSVRERTAASPFARAFFTMAEGLDLVPAQGADTAGAGNAAR